MYLLTTTHHLLAFDGEESFFLVHSGKGLYYGLAHNGAYLYVACRNQTTGPDDAEARARERGSILVFDAASLAFVAELSPEDFPLRDVHGIAFFDGRLWVTSSHDNMIAVFDTAARQWTRWYPSIDVGARDRDVNHFNTIVPDGERIWLLAHNHGASQLLAYDRSSLDLCSALDLRHQAHDVFRVDGSLGTCSSADGLLVARSGWALRTGAFPRGVVQSAEGVLVGLSQLAPRSMRRQMTAIVRRFTPQWRYAGDFVLPGVGMILAILRLDADRSVLASMEPFEAQRFDCEYNPVEPGNVYGLGDQCEAVRGPEWHTAEETHRWTAARESRMTIVVNPGETAIGIDAFSSFPGTYSSDVLLNGRYLGSIPWTQPGLASLEFPLPRLLQGRCELSFRVPHLWQPSTILGTGDQRMLGIGVRELKLF
jgi:hypothetical protein